MSAGSARLAYLRRVLAVYCLPQRGPLSFWYEMPQMNVPAAAGELGEYYMTFQGKAAYMGPFDADGIPLLDYRGTIGRQYNPIAIAQYGLAQFNLWRQTRTLDARRRWIAVADWLTASLTPNAAGVPVWQHHFDWPYRETLAAPWHSGLAQGQGLSMLMRAHLETGDGRYLEAAGLASEAFDRSVTDGGVMFVDAQGNPWIEEYIVTPPSHILNGFMWALWGLYDLAIGSRDARLSALFDRCVLTLVTNLPRFDTGSWSLYELPASGPPMLASPYYHRLHIVQLRVMHRLTGRAEFAECADRWTQYAESVALRALALTRKAWFKLRHY